MSFFRRRPRGTANAAGAGASPEPFSELVASDSGGGVLSFSLLDRATGTMAPLPPIELLLRRTEDLQAVVDTLRSAGAGDADLPLTEQVAPGIVTTLGLDEGARFSTLGANSLIELRLTPALARSGAWARLRQAASRLTIEGGGGRLRVTLPENPDMTASFMLITETWLDTAALQGTPVFAVGNRVSLHVCGSDDADSLTGLREIAETFHRQSVDDPAAYGRPLTPRLLTLRDGVLVEFDRG